MKFFKYFLLFPLFFPSFLTAQDVVWPGDVNNNGIVNEVDLLYLALGYGETGPTRKTISATWEAQSITNIWETSLTQGLDLAFADCNGDGIVDSLDVQVINDNFGLQHIDVPFQADEIPAGIPNISPAFSNLSEDLRIFPNTETKEIQIGLGDSLISVDKLLGISFYIKADPNFFDVQATDFQFDNNGWLGTDNAAVIKRIIPSGRSAVGDFVVAYAKTNKTPASGSGLIGNLTLSPSFIFEGDVPDFKIIIDSIVLIDQELNKVPVLGTEITFQTDRFRDSTAVNTSICQGESLRFKQQDLTESGIYYDTLKNEYGGDSIIYMNLSVLDTAQTLLTESICAGESITFNEQLVSKAGLYRDTLVNANGCDRYVLLNLEVLDTSQTLLNRSICAGEQIEFNEQFIAEAGLYRDTLVNANGCDRYVLLNVEILDTLQTLLERTICFGDSLIFDGQVLRNSGTYRDTLVAANGCDRYVVLNLEVLGDLGTSQSQTICAGETFLFNNQQLSTSGIYQDTLSATDGCDSLIVLDLTVIDKTETLLIENICEGNTRSFNGQTITTTGEYRDTLTNVKGCDSIIILQLNVTDKLETTLDARICQGESYTFNNLDISNEGSYLANFIAHNGCDSVVALNLTVDSSVTQVIREEFCQGETYSFNNQILDAPGIYLDTLQSVNGCDSFIELSLKQLEAYETNIEGVLCPNDTFRFHSFVLTTPNIYTVTLNSRGGCDSVIILDLKTAETAFTTIDSVICPGESMLFHGMELNEAGEYSSMLQTTAGCDSLVVLNLEIGDSSCVKVGVENPVLATINIFPNPSTSQLFIESPSTPVHSIQLVNITGQLVYMEKISVSIQNEVIQVDMQHLNPSVYWLRIETEDGIRQEKIIKL